MLSNNNGVYKKANFFYFITISRIFLNVQKSAFIWLDNSCTTGQQRVKIFHSAETSNFQVFTSSRYFFFCFRYENLPFLRYFRCGDRNLQVADLQKCIIRSPNLSLSLACSVVDFFYPDVYAKSGIKTSIWNLSHKLRHKWKGFI